MKILPTTKMTTTMNITNEEEEEGDYLSRSTSLNRTIKRSRTVVGRW